MHVDDLLVLDKKHIWHPCSQMQDYETYPPIHIQRGEGVWLYREDGSRILDAISSWWVNIFGHGNPIVKGAIKAQLDELEHVLFAGYTHTPAITLAAHLTRLLGGKLPRVFFTDNGSSAVEVALKMSFHYWYNQGEKQRTKFFYLKGAYHGETLGALAVGSLDLFKEIYAPLLMPSASEVAGPDCYRCPLGKERTSCGAECFSAMEEQLGEHHRETCAVIIEPVVQGAAGMNIYPPLYVNKLRRLCDTYGVHLICDEIATGFGRTGRMLACEHAEVVPDFVILSKAITNGSLPLAAVLTTEEVYRAFYAPYTAMKAFMHSHTYTANPLACAAACAVFDLFAAGDVLGQVAHRGAEIRKQVLPLAGHPHVGDIRSCGIITALEVVQDKTTKKPFDWQKRTGYRIYRRAEELGVLLRPLGDVLYFIPPYTINQEEIAFMTGAARQAITEILV